MLVGRLLIISLTAIILLKISIPISAGNLNFEYIDINNNTKNLNDFKGEPLLVDAFATWCEPCKIEIGHLKEIYSLSRDQINIVSLSVSPNSDTVNLIKDFRNDYEAGWEFGIDKENKFTNAFKVFNIPSLYLFDSEGELVKVWEGVTDPQDIADELKDSLGIELGKVNYDAQDAIKDQLSQNNLFQITSSLILILIAYNMIVPKSKPTNP